MPRVHAGGAVEALPATLLPAPTHLSWSQVARLVPDASQYACARSWAYDKRLGLPFKPGAAMAVGSAIDEGLNGYFAMVLLGRRAEGPVAGLSALRERWGTDRDRIDPALTAGEADDYERVAVQGFDAMLEFCGDVVPAAVQTRHEFTVGVGEDRARKLLGFSDRIDADGVIVDHKYTGSAKWSGGEWDASWLAEKRVQLTTYYLARLAEERRGLRLVDAPVVPRARLEVVYHNRKLAKPQVRHLEFDLDEQDVARALALIRAADAVAVSGRYAANPGRQCSWCSYAEHCRADFLRHEQSFEAACGVPEPSLAGAA